MKVFKFGGASVKDIDSVKNIVKVLKTNDCEDCFTVISAMGKTTNALEEVVQRYFEKEDFNAQLKRIKDNHYEIIDGLFENPEKIKSIVKEHFNELNDFLGRNKSPNYDFVYDQVVCLGELISTRIVSEYLNSVGIENTWIDARDYIKTDDTYREGQVDWKQTEENLQTLDLGEFYITQGFIGSDANHFSTTLGREGSDYTAAIIAYCLNAESMTIWKDVPGVMNADPRQFEEAQLLHRISYEEAIELAYYGASVIHPKTLKPLLQKQIPFYVKSFIEPTSRGTEIKNGSVLEPYIPCYIVKKNQNLLTLTTADFSFITEDKISHVFSRLAALKIKVNLMQNSALTLSLCLEDKFNQLNKLIEMLNEDYTIDWEKNVSLYTLRHFDDTASNKFQRGTELLRQTIKNTLQLIVRE